MISFSVLIITHDREELLSKCLDSLKAFTGHWQLIIVANGLPLSSELINKANTLTSECEILTTDHVESPGRSRNLGLERVKYEWVYFLDDDAYLLPRYYEILEPLLKIDKIDVLGGPDSPASGMEPFSEALGVALSSPFCSGSTFARHQSKGRQLIAASEELLTSCNLWVRTRLLKEVKFPENYRRTEETALLLDLKGRQAQMFYHPHLKVGHHRRSTLSSLWRPTFDAGFFRSKVLKEKTLGDGKMFWLPMIFVLLHLLIFITPSFFFTLARLYLGLIVMMSLNLASRRKKISLFGYIAFFHYFIVIVYGMGFLVHRIGLGRRENSRS